MPSTPPPVSNSKILYEEGDTHGGLTTWSPSHRRLSKKSKGPIYIAVIVAFLMFILGLSIGAFTHAVLYPDGGSPLVQLPSFLLSDNNTTNDTIYYDSEESSSEEEPVEIKEDEIIAKMITSEEKSASSELQDFEEVEEAETTTTQKSKSKHEKKKNERAEKKKSDEQFMKEHKECMNITWYSTRLPKFAKPIEYDLTLHPNLTTNKVVANVKIVISIKESTNQLILNAEDLKMKSFVIFRGDDKLDAEFMDCKLMTQWAWKLSKKLKKNDRIELIIDYESEMRSDLQGLYISTHVGTNGIRTKSAATQFEPTFARKMLPCFDEPNFKATFQVSIIREPDHVARSNMNLIVSKEQKNGLIKDVFEKSVKMSTYLLAVAILDKYDNVRRLTKHTQKPIEVRLYAPNDVIVGQSEFGLDTTIRALEFFESYFNISYPLEKIDLLALDDFSEGAMENWGLVTFRDSALLFDENKASVVAKEHIALIICHEIAHQWFGNLVTMDWWNEVFLNEGFANYMEYKCVDELFPDWNIMTRFYAENLAFSQEPDGFLSSRAIESDDDDSLLNLFDAINYHKAAAIIHMIAEMAGQKNFQRALVEYLNKYAYANAKGVELWKIVEKHANLQGGVSIPDLAKAYTTQVGYPLINLEFNKSTITVHNQTRFLFSESEKAVKNRGDHKWPIPISYRTKNEEATKLHWIYADDKDVSWDIVSSDDWLIVNTGGVGYFKVQYDHKMYKKLTKQLRQNHTMISAIDRAMLLVDAFDLTRTSHLEIDTYLDLVEYSEHENDKMTWTIINKHLRTIESLIEDTEYINLFKDFERSLVLKLYESFDWDSKQDTPMKKGLQIEAFQMACRLRIRDCNKQAYQRYLKWLSDGIRYPEHHGVVLEEGVAQGGSAAWERIWQAYGEATSPSERNNIIGALASVKDITLINRLLKYCIDGQIKQNLIPRVFSSLSLHETGRNAAWRFFKLHFDKFHSLMGTGSTLLASCVRCLSEPLTTKQDLLELKEFLEEKKLEEEGQMKMEQTYEQVELNIQWRESNEERVGKWLNHWDERRRKLYRRRRHRHF